MWAPCLALALAACAELGTDPDRAAALEFEGVPFPALIAGDTLRDAAGVATRLGARAYNGAGIEIPGAPFEFILLDTGATVADGFLHATRRDGGVRVVASIDGLQSLPKRIEVTRRPDSLAASGAAVDTLEYALPDVAANSSPTLGVTLRSDDVAGGLSPNVAGWLVRWRVIHAGDTLAASDTVLATLRKGTRHALLDTTGADGASTRTLRVFANALPAIADSFIVVAEVRRHGTLLRGSPRRFVVHVRPQP